MAGKKVDLKQGIASGIDKFFTPLVVNTQESSEAHEEHHSHDVQTTHEAQEVEGEELAEARKTQGRKGYKLPRINISLTPSQYEYIHVMARVTGKSVTKYISDMIDNEIKGNRELYDKAKDIIAATMK